MVSVGFQNEVHEVGRGKWGIKEEFKRRQWGCIGTKHIIACLRFSIKIGMGERFRNSQFQRTAIYSVTADEKRDKDPSEEEVPASACGSQRGLQRPGKWELVCVHPPAVWPFRSAGFPRCTSSQAPSNEDSATVSRVTHVSTL